jgi:hypothetical protein
VTDTQPNINRLLSHPELKISGLVNSGWAVAAIAFFLAAANDRKVTFLVLESATIRAEK